MTTAVRNLGVQMYIVDLVCSRPTDCRAERILAFSYVAATLIHSGNRNNWSQSALCGSTVCISLRVCAHVIPNKGSHSWRVAVETRVALLNTYQYEHAHSHGNPVKAGSVWQRGMLNRGWMGKLKHGILWHPHWNRSLQAWEASLLRLEKWRPSISGMDVIT